MKQWISGFLGLLGLAALVLFLLMALQFRPLAFGSGLQGDPTEPLKPSITPPPYPPPDPAQYPAPDTVPYSAYPGPAYAYPTLDCSQASRWKEYIHQQGGFSFLFPAESELHESPDQNVYVNLRPGCYSKACTDSIEVYIAMLPNPDGLSLDDFVLQKFITDASVDLVELKQKLDQNSRKIKIDGITALRVDGEIRRYAPAAYIPHAGQVIYVGLSRPEMPPFGPACGTILDLYEQILMSVRIIP